MFNPYENFDASRYPFNLNEFWDKQSSSQDLIDNYPPIFERLICELKPNIILELGSYKGKSAIQFANLCKKHNLSTKICCVDTWLGSAEHEQNNDLMKVNGWPTIFYQFLANIVHTGHEDCVIPIPMDTMSNYRLMKSANTKVPLIYVDAGHYYESVHADIKYYWEVLENGGVMLGDDYCSKTWPDVVRAVHEFFPEDQIHVEGEKWWVQKQVQPQQRSTLFKSW